ncbi:hypothetical protein V8G54_009294 [Vigna mungo]|uniref:Transposase MuDR plant domain-containing protein n=1 Tax=Vigna mungo TaxID=3915 RepID=A0AAQ3NWX4_VIGMU
MASQLRWFLSNPWNYRQFLHNPRHYRRFLRNPRYYRRFLRNPAITGGFYVTPAITGGFQKIPLVPAGFGQCEKTNWNLREDDDNQLELDKPNRKWTRVKLVVPDRLELLTDDRGVMHMMNIARLNDEVHLYVVHNTMEPRLIEMIDCVDAHVDDEGDVARQVEEGGGDADGKLGTKMEKGDGDVDGQGEGDVDAQVGTQMEEGEGDAQGDSDVSKEMQHVVGDGAGNSNDVDDFELEDVEENGDVDEVKDEDVHEDEDVGEDVHGDVQCESVNEESLVDVTIQCDIGTSKGKVTEEPCTLVGECSRKTDIDSIHDVCGMSDIDATDSEEDEDDIGTYGRFSTFTMPKSLDEYKWEVGTFFNEKKEFTEAIRTYALSHGRNLKFIKNDKKMVFNSWQLRKVIDDHSCTRDFNVKFMTSKWMSQMMEKTVRENPNMKVMDTRDKGGELLIAVERDENEQILQITYVVVEFWSRSRFTPTSHCDTLMNNMCEGFNSVLVHTRSKPIITMLEDIKVYIMKRWATNRTKMTSYQGFVCSKVFNRFQKESWLTRYWLPRKSTYEETYKTIISPINGQHVWEITSYPDVLPPKKRTMPGRPKKKQRLEAWEMKKNDSELRKGETRKRCGLCKRLGHNKKSFPQRPPTVMLPNQSTQQTEVIIFPPTYVLPTQQSNVLPTNQSIVLPTQQSTMLPTQQSTVLPTDK